MVSHTKRFTKEYKYPSSSKIFKIDKTSREQILKAVKGAEFENVREIKLTYGMLAELFEFWRRGWKLTPWEISIYWENNNMLTPREYTKWKSPRFSLKKEGRRRYVNVVCGGCKVHNEHGLGFIYRYEKSEGKGCYIPADLIGKKTCLTDPKCRNLENYYFIFRGIVEHLKDTYVKCESCLLSIKRKAEDICRHYFYMPYIDKHDKLRIGEVKEIYPKIKTREELKLIYLISSFPEDVFNLCSFHRRRNFTER